MHRAAFHLLLEVPDNRHDIADGSSIPEVYDSVRLVGEVASVYRTHIYHRKETCGGGFSHVREYERLKSETTQIPQITRVLWTLGPSLISREPVCHASAVQCWV